MQLKSIPYGLVIVPSDYELNMKNTVGGGGAY